jgi:hypothetical protein
LLKVKVEDTNALRFILEDEIYLLNADKSLYASPPKSQPEIETQQPVFNYLGSNKKNFLVLVSYDAHEFMKDEHLAALESVLGRLAHTRDDVVIFNLAKHAPVNQEQLFTFFEPKTMLILGKAAMPAGIDLKLNTIEKSKGADILYTYSFDEMMTSIENKKAFWEQMKTL